MNAVDEARLAAVIAGLDSAMGWLEVELARLQRALDAGVQLETICELNRIIYRTKAQ